MSQLPGRVITFYSFKGGTGRSMALANIATEIAQRNGNRVLVVDWDLEAPGLHRYFRPYLSLDGVTDRDDQITNSRGLIELVCAAREAVSSEPSLSREELVDKAFHPIKLGDFTLRTDLPSLSLMKAGTFDASYSSRINSFDWTKLFAAQPQFFGAFADYLASQFTHVLIDSRTGYTDISGICTSLLPDTLVVVFTPNLQSLDGALDAVERAVTYRVESDDLRPLRTFPLVSRVELSELNLNDSWRFGDAFQDIPGYQPRFERLLEKLYGIESCDLTIYFDRAQVAYVPYYAFGEKIAARSEESGTVRLARSFSDMTDLLLSASSACELERPAQDAETRVEIPWDDRWFNNQHLPPDDWAIEVRASLSRVRPSAPLNNRFTALRGSVASARLDDGNMMVRNNMISAEVVTTRRGSAYWNLRTNGDCLLSRRLSEASGSVAKSARELAEAVADTLLSLRRFYINLGITPRADLRIQIRFPALHDYTRDEGLSTETTWPGQVKSAGDAVLGRIEDNLVTLTRHFSEPLLELFERTRLDDETYERIVDEVRAASAS